MLVPKSHKYGHALRGRSIQIFLSRSRLPAPRKPCDGGGEVDDKIIDTVDQYPDRERDQEARDPMV